MFDVYRPTVALSQQGLALQDPLYCILFSLDLKDSSDKEVGW